MAMYIKLVCVNCGSITYGINNGGYTLCYKCGKLISSSR
jgi:hypothetical protein